MRSSNAFRFEHWGYCSINWGKDRRLLASHACARATFFVLPVLLAFLLSGCQIGASLSSSAVTYVTFTPSTSYTTAMTAITNLGLRHTSPCKNNVIVPDGASTRWTRWESLDEQSSFDGGLPRTLWVTSTVLAPSDWPTRLQSLAIVSSLTQSVNMSCGAYQADATPTPGVPYYLTMAEAGAYAHVSIGLESKGSPALTYDQAVTALNDLGLRLADPCREQQLQGRSVTASKWTPVGQQQQYAKTRQLVVATTTDASDQWQGQAQTIAKGTSVQTPYKPIC